MLRATSVNPQVDEHLSVESQCMAQLVPHQLLDASWSIVGIGLSYALQPAFVNDDPREKRNGKAFGRMSPSVAPRMADECSSAVPRSISP